MFANNSDTTKYINPDNTDWLAQLNDVILEYIEKEDLSNAFLAQKMNVSESHFYRLVKERTGKTPNKYIRVLKLNFAKTLLESGKFEHISTVAYQVGFKRVDYFSRLFEEQFGVRPKVLIDKKSPLNLSRG